MEKDITKNVVHALNLDSGRLTSLIRQHFPAASQSFFLNSAAVVGTTKHTFFAAGFWRYIQLVAKKQQ
jgi:hypothetical protein